MRDLFSPLFGICLTALFLGQGLTVYAALMLPLAGLLAAGGIAAFLLRRHLASYLFVAAALGLLLLSAFCRHKEAWLEARLERFPRDDYVTVRGVLEDFPGIEEQGTVLRLRAESMEWERRTRRGEWRLRVKVMGDLSGLDRGAGIEIAARILPAGLSQNFGANRYADYLLAEGIHRQAYCKSAGLVRVVRRPAWTWRAIGGWRRSIRRLIGRSFAEGQGLAPPGAFFEATLLGDRGRLDGKAEEELIRAGVLHLIAISGANIGIIAFCSLFALRLIGAGRRWRYGLTSLILLLFLVISGFDLSARRAVFMALLLFFGRLAFYDHEITNLIGFSGLAMLAWNPAHFLAPGFVLTYFLTYVLVLSRRAAIFWSRIKIAPLRELLAANTSASLFSLPLSLYFFFRCSLAGLFSGLALVPLAAVITAVGLLLIPLAPLLPSVALMLLRLVDPVLRLFFFVTGLAARLGWELFRRPPPPLLIGIAFLLLAFLARPGRSRRARMAAWLALGLAWAFSLRPAPAHRPQRLELYFLDVGQGDCQVAVFPDGTGLLVDGGGGFLSDFPVGRRLVLPFLLQRGIRVKWLAVTHFHPDHVSGAVELLPILKPEEVWIASAPAENSHFRRLNAAAPKGSRIVSVAAGFRRAVAGCTIEAIHPPVFGGGGTNENDRSLVLRIADDRHSFLLTGDIEARVEGGLVGGRAALLRADVLKIGHHGSGRSSSPEFLAAVAPEVAVVSCAEVNAYGFPHRRLLDELRRRGIPWLGTGRRGGILVRSDPGRLQIEVSK